MFKFKQKIPVTVVGGFLGAGKTTLVNHLIKTGGRRFGVIVNEFGDIGVDGALIENLDSDGVTEFAGGCICCAGRDDLAEAMYKLAMRTNPPQHLLIELSGLADPVPVAQTVLDPQLRGLFELDGIVGVVDARHLERTLQEVPEGAVQIAYASVVVLNKTDLVTNAQLERARELIARLNPLAQIVETTNAAAPSEVLEQRAFSEDWKPKGHVHEHASDVTSFAVSCDAPLDVLSWNAFMDDCILTRPGNVFRVKGFLSFAQLPEELIFQAVREIVYVTKSERPTSGVSSLVVIGRGLDQAEYQQRFSEADKPLSLEARLQRWGGQLQTQV